jgi:hypothetical protein
MQQPRDREASLFVAETMPLDAPTADHDPNESAKHLDQPECLEKLDKDCDYQHWGTVSSEVRPSDIHHLYHAPKQISHSSGTLTDLLKDPSAVQMTPLQRLQLATLIAISYIHFSLVRQSCADIKPSSFCYYSNSDSDDPWCDDELRIMTPYLDTGFRQRPPATRLGERSGVSKSQNALIVGLGLLLFQIGCCTTLQYDLSAKALLEAKRKVSYNLHLLDLRVSSVYTEVTQACLQYISTAARGDSGSVDRFLESVVSRLFSLQEAF